MALALVRCTFAVGSWDKRFARDIAAQLGAHPNPPRLHGLAGPRVGGCANGSDPACPSF